MNITLKAAIAAACALGLSAAYAQTVQRGETSAAKPAQQTVAQASGTAPIQTAQAGGAAEGAAAGGATAGVGTTLVIVGAAIVAIAVASESGSGSGSTVAH